MLQNRGERYCGSLPYIDSRMDVINTWIRIKPDPDLYQADFDIEYTVRAKADSAIIVPLLFPAVEGTEELRIWIDGIPVTSTAVSQDALLSKESLTRTFPNFVFGSEELLQEDPLHAYPLDGMLSLRAELSPGIHRIRTCYRAKSHVLLKQWVKRVEFRYSMLPSRFWNSMGSVDIEVDVSGSDLRVESNLPGRPANYPKHLYRWTFAEFSGDELIVRPIPHVTRTAGLLMSLRPGMSAFLLTVLFIVLHLYYIIGARVKKVFIPSPEERFLFVGAIVLILFNYLLVLPGLLLILPLLLFNLWCTRRLPRWKEKVSNGYLAILVGGIFVIPWFLLRMRYGCYGWIDKLVGDYASGFHGSETLSMKMYPLYVILYGMMVWTLLNGAKLAGLSRPDTVEKTAKPRPGYRTVPWRGVVHRMGQWVNGLIFEKEQTVPRKDPKNKTI